ncbi:MAG TPA: TolC family protein [Polyangia bacterium]|nr:TolC family protein [Polyangia bacterium]
MRSVRSIFLSSLTFLIAWNARAADGDEAELARSARLETIVRVALERNPDLAEIQARARAAQARSDAASRLPDLEAKYEQWGVPLQRPYALDEAQMLMVGVRQTFPAWGSLDARGRAAAEEAGGVQDASRARRQEIAAQVRRTYAAYYRSDQELRLHLEHVGLTSRILELARLNQRTGHGSLQDVLRLEVELTRVHTDVARLEREQRSSRALLNALMNRPGDAPLGPPEDLSITPRTDVAALERNIDANRPEVAAGARTIRRDEALVDSARSSGRFPQLMLGLDYWYMPTFPSDMRHAYSAMVAITLPWLSGRHGAEQREAEESLQADRHALEATKNTVRYQLRDAAARVDSARQSFSIIDQDVLAQAKRSLEATQAAYAAGQGDAVGLLDALRSYLQVRIERVRALAELAMSEADLERAAGTLAAGGETR